MNLRAEPYLATLLAGENSPLDLRGHAPGRMRRLGARVAASIAPVHSLSLGELAAMSWLAETWTQQDAAKRFPDRVIALDFDRFLADVAGNMERILAHFELPADAHYLAGVARSSCLTRYSKAPEFAYTPATRIEVLDDSRRANRDEIRKGMEWLHRLARSDAGAAAVLNAGGP
jgi:predicted nucleic acid-binding protein